jgi:hypothetical protein
MAIHTDLPIYRKGCELLALAFEVQRHMPRAFKRQLGEKITCHCVDILDYMALANAAKGDRRQRAWYIRELLKCQRACVTLMRVGHDMGHIPHGVWATSVQLLDNIGRQGGGWLKSTNTEAPVA